MKYKNAMVMYIYILVLEIFIYDKHQETNGLNPTDQSSITLRSQCRISATINQIQDDPRR